MSTHQIHSEKGVFYFTTFTCYKWLPLIEQSQSYEYFEKWFTEISNRGCLVNGFVIMPNHLHIICYPTQESKGLNHIIGEAKRFLAYEIVKRLKNQKKINLLKALERGVRASEKSNGKKHQVFKLSFDAKEISSKKGFINILDYIHHNPVKGKWSLANDFVEYPHSSAAYYELGESKPSFLTDYRDV